jgi:hypothetical protein
MQDERWAPIIHELLTASLLCSGLWPLISILSCHDSFARPTWSVTAQVKTGVMRCRCVSYQFRLSRSLSCLCCLDGIISRWWPRKCARQAPWPCVEEHGALVGRGEAPACCNCTHLLFLIFSGVARTERDFYQEFLDELWGCRSLDQKWRESRSSFIENYSDGSLFSGCIAPCPCSVLDWWLYEFADKISELPVIQGLLKNNIGNKFQESQSSCHFCSVQTFRS